jgi:hypothetical protein
MIGRRDHSVQASIAELAHQRARVGLDDGDRNLRAIVAEAVQQCGRDGRGDLAGDAESDRPDQARLEIGSRRARLFGRCDDSTGTLQEELAGGGELDSAAVALEELDPELVLESV